MSHLSDMSLAIDDLLEKVAAQEDGKKYSEANTEAGGYQGSTTHPVKDVDDSTEDAQEGARSSENHSDVKADQGSPGVDSTAEGTPGGQDSVTMDIGVTSKATGEDSTSENDYKDGKDDPGSSHPARTDNESLDGHKYSSDIRSLQQLCKQSEEIGSKLLAAIATETNGETKKAAQELANKQAASSKAANTEEGYTDSGVCKGCGENPCQCKTAEAKNAARARQTQQAKEAEESGYDLAGIFADIDIPTEDKQAADRMVVDEIDDLLSIADLRAYKCAQFYAGQAEAARKQAEEEENRSEKEKSDFLAGGSEEGDDDAAAAAEGSSAADESMLPVAEDAEGEEDILALLNGGEAMGAEDAAGAMGPPPAGGGDPLASIGGDPLAAGGGADPLAAMAAGGGDPMAAGGGDPMAAGGGMDDAAALEAALSELGISLEDLQMFMANKAASTLRDRIQKRAGKTGEKQMVTKPKTAADRQRVQNMIGVVQEIIGRNS